MNQNRNIIKEIATMTNLYWAWEKTKWFYKPGDIWFDEIEIAAFEANVSNELKRISEDLFSGSYQMSSIKPVPFPKKKDKNGNTRTRQTFWVSVRDQVTWIAVVNIIGRHIDIKMPFWSYGNRLYISTFYEENEQTNKNELKFGFYRNTSKYTFRKWSQSWPLYRRHICLTSKFLSGNYKNQELEDLDKDAILVNDSLKPNHPLKVDFIKSDYWPSNKQGELFWAGLDLEKFYPNVKLSSIKSNILKYFSSNDESFNSLIDSLLHFKLDLIGWENEELERIQINEHEKLYLNIPTGLFVGGFLANVALLDIDMIISNKLKSNRNVAQFRYVDDHVIIANSFEQLISWIEEYEKILKQSSVFTNEPINSGKTEPASLGEYFRIKKDEENLDSNIKDFYEKAKNECEIDPEFPSPLMTQTLSKVSKIAGTEFQLLDPEEQKGIISDIEHLLLTEFPDNELRRDTRISFAASMLTSFIPKITFDETRIYELTKRIFDLKSKDVQEPNDEKNIEIKKVLTQLEMELEFIKKDILKQEKKIINRTVKLLKKAVRENHQKVRLWARLVEFCYKSGGQIENEIIDEVLRLIENKESNKLSVTYIQSLIIQVLNNQLVNAYKVVNNEKALYKAKERAKLFLEGLLDNTLIKKIISDSNKNQKFYQSNTINTFKFTLGTIIYLVERNQLLSKNIQSKNLIEDNNLVNWYESPKLFADKTSHKFEAWIWWFTNKILDFDNNEPSEIWYLAIEKIDIYSEIGQAVISQYPKYLPFKVINKINLKFKELPVFQNEGWMFDVYRGINHNESEISTPNFLSQFIKNQNRYENFITLDRWIQWTNDQQKNTFNVNNNDSLIFDPRLGEWMALEITKQIAKEIDHKTENLEFDFDFDLKKLNKHNDYHKTIHPYNFKISKKFTQNKPISWSDLKILIERGEHVSFVAKENRITDKRFASLINNSSSYSDKIESIISALGAILVCLLSKNLDLPNKWNPIGHHFVWLELMNSMLRKVAVSSYTRDIISGCFSKRNIETKRLIQNRVNFDLIAEDDYKKDPPRFVTITDFINYVQLSQKILEEQRISVSDNQPRQLIPISLIQMTSAEYQKLIDETEEL